MAELSSHSLSVEERALHVERVRMLVGDPVYVILLAHVFGASVLVAALVWMGGDSPLMVVWWCAVVAVALFRGACMRHWHRQGITADRAARVALYFCLLCFLAGALWGVGTALFLDPGNLPGVTLISVLLMGMVTGGIGPLGAYFPAYCAFVVAALVPFSARMLSFDDPLFAFFGTMAAVFLFCCLLIAYFLHRRIGESIRLRFHNRNLIADLEVRRREAERANEAKGRFLAAASHDLRQPLHSLCLCVDMLESESDPSAREGLIRNIRSSLEVTNELITGLLDVSGLDAGLVNVSPQSFALAPTFEHLAQVNWPYALDKEVRLRIRATSAYVYTDPTLLQRILINLLSNAIRYTPSGGRVLMAARPDGDHWRIEVRDNGPGIAEEYQEVIFDDFRRCTDDPSILGLGLGLAIVRRSADLLGLDLELRSVEGSGSMFSVRVPAAAGCSSEEGALAITEPVAAPVAAGQTDCT